MDGETIRSFQSPSPAFPPGLSKREPNRFSPARFGGWLFVVDIAAILVACLLASLAARVFDARAEAPHPLTIAIGIVVIMVTMKSFDVYKSSTILRRAKEVYLVGGALTFAFLLILGVQFSYGFLAELSKAWFVSWYVIALGSTLLVRSFVWNVMYAQASRGKLRRRLAIYGEGPQSERFVQRLEDQADGWVSIVGVFDDRAPARAGHGATRAAPGSVVDLINMCREDMVDDVIVALPWSAERRIRQIVAKLENLPVNIRVAPDMLSFSFPEVDFDALSGMAVLNVTPHPLSGPWAVLKSLEDFIISGILVILALPFLAIIAALVKFTSPGPILYSQPRLGLNNRIFHVLKFRTMYHGRPPENGTPQATKGDPRVTPLGRFLRKTSIDELPQLFNVLEGSMSLVGPRPHAIAHNKYYGDVIDRYFVRHRVKPGITGWAQVNGYRGETEIPEKMRKRVEYDIAYIENWSPLLDAIILVKTALVVFFQRTAY